MIVAVFGLCGCTTVSFYAQAIGGHVDIMTRRVPVAELLETQSDGELKKRLELAMQARDFASDRLGLPDNESYRSYVDLQRKYVTWNVIATEEFSVQAREWCFPVAGCVPYRGYFSQAAAHEFGARLSRQELDVHVNGASAYSTLGWFDDPLLSTMLRWRETRLVGVIFHELSHQVVWVENDTTFNESFAVFVQREGVRWWLRERGAAAQIDDYEANLQRQREFVSMLLETREKLAALYAGSADAAATRARKQQIFAQMRENYAALKRTRWEGYSGYDNWFDQPLNNARLALAATYNDYVGSFAQLFMQAGGDFPTFYRLVRALAELPRERREIELHELAARPAPRATNVLSTISSTPP
ncbi:MAG: aminopeptidase [Gammaproteobacteria bacterium]|nr:aminopeptidase [Gammaproteobacteria bacterium]